MDYNDYRNFWTPFIVYLTLLGVYLIILGIALAGLVSALRGRDQNTPKATGRSADPSD